MQEDTDSALIKEQNKDAVPNSQGEILHLIHGNDNAVRQSFSFDVLKRLKFEIWPPKTFI